MSDQHCELCDVYLPSKEAIEQHNLGKKHLKLMQIENDRKNVEEKSVFLYGFPGNSLTVDDFSAFFAAGNVAIDKIIMDPNKTTFAIIEFQEASPAQKLLEDHKIKVKDVVVMVKKRVVPKRVHQLDENTQNLDVKNVLSNMIGDIDTQMQALVSQVQLADMGERKAVCEKLDKALKNVMPQNMILKLFGSSVTGLGESNSDIDATFVFSDSNGDAMDVDEVATPKSLLRSRTYLLNNEALLFTEDGKITKDELESLSEGDKIRFISKMLNFVRKKHHLHISQQTPILARRCPVVRFVIDNKYRCDICVNNQEGILNSRWLQVLVEKEQRFMILCSFVRIWFKYYELSGSEPHLLNNYSITLILVVFMQIQGIFPPVETYKADLETLDREWKTENSKLCRGLLKEFFVFFNGLKLNRSIVSSKLGQVHVVQKDEDGKEPKDLPFALSCLNVQDPFVIDHNTTALFTHKGVTALRSSLAHACEIVQKEEWNLVDLMGEVGKNGHGSNSSSPSLGKGCASEKFCICIPECNLPENFEKVCANLGRIFVGILKFEQIDPSHVPEAKRKRFEGSPNLIKKMGFRITQQNTWKGRRHARREVMRELPGASLWQIEMKVTEKLMQELSPSRLDRCYVEMDMVVCVEQAIQASKPGLHIEMRHVTGPQVVFSNVVHFINPFLEKFKEIIVQ